MKKAANIFKIFSLICIMAFGSGCNDDASLSSGKKDNFSFEMSDLVGIWEANQIKDNNSGEWFEVNNPNSSYYLFSFSVRFMSDYTYLLNSTTNSESGTYTAEGTVVETYEDKKLKAEYFIKSLSSSEMSLTLVRGTDATDYILKKRDLGM